MADVIIQNPILNSPFEEPTRYFRFSDDRIGDLAVESAAACMGTAAVVAARRPPGLSSPAS